MTSERPYAAAVEPAKAVEEIQRCAGTQFDPAVVTAFVAVWERQQLVDGENEPERGLDAAAA